MRIKDLPVQPGAGDLVKNSYISERDGVTTPEELRAFVKRWVAIFEMTKHRSFDKRAKGSRRFRLTKKSIERLVDGSYDAGVALKCLMASKTENGCQHITQFSCPGAHIALPPFLLDADLVSSYFGVPTDIAIIQMRGGVGALE